MKKENRIYTRRVMLLYGILFFLIGAGLGGVVGIYSLRYMLFHRPPPTPEQMTTIVLDRIGADFTLSAAQREGIGKELLDLHYNIIGVIDGGRKEIDGLIEARAQVIAGQFPNGAAQGKWLKQYREYFPRPPNPPGK
jgi:hypothetical protein